MSTASAPRQRVPDNPLGAAPPEAASGFRRHGRFLFQCSVLAEAGLGLSCLVGAAGLRSLLARQSPLDWTTLAVGLALVGLAVASSAAVRGIAGVVAAPRLAVGGAVSAAACVFTLLFLVRGVGNGTSRPLILIAAGLLILTFGLGHSFARQSLERRSLRQPRFVAVVGGPQQRERLMSHLPPGSGWSVVASLDDQVTGQLQLHQDLNVFREKLRTEPVDEVILMASIASTGPHTTGIYREVSQMCELAGLKLRVVADWLDDYREVEIDYLGTQPLLTFSFASNSPWLRLVKRIVDLGVAAVMLSALLPVLLLAALMIKIDSPGPVLFRQTRCGLRGRLFTIYKLRSMVINAEALKDALLAANELDGPVFKIANDPRMTRVGRWLRRTSIDELPQLWNVLTGSMSLVGPRPPTPGEVAQYPLGSLQRLAMKPGITGLWQVSGRSRLRDFDRWVALDAEYIRNWSLLLDLKIMVRTLWVVARMTGT